MSCFPVVLIATRTHGMNALFRNQIDLSLRSYPHEKKTAEELKETVDPRHPVVINCASEARENMLLKGYIESVLPEGVTIKFATDLKAIVPFSEALDGESDFSTLKKVYPFGKLCYARVTRFVSGLRHQGSLRLNKSFLPSSFIQCCL